MKKSLLVPLLFLSAGCGLLQPRVQVVTATPPPQVIVVTATSVPATATPEATNTPRPTRTPSPTPEPTWEPIALTDVEAALQNDGYRRFPFVDADGVHGFSWVKDNAYERVRTWENGTISLEVLHDESSEVRSEHMERKFELLDAALPIGFMARLRQEHAAYNRSVGSSVSGEPDQIFAYHDEWQTVWGEYNASDVQLGGYGVRFSLWWWQSTCPSQYLYCYYSDFPGLEFTGDSSFVFHSIMIWLPEGGGEDQPSA
jgi:hypothetical protein